MSSWRQIVSWTIVSLWMGLIFYLSHQPGEESSALSEGVMSSAITWMNSIVLKIDLHHAEWLHTLIRKGAHFAAYLILALFVMNALGRSSVHGKNRIVWAISICVAYAITDEWHQLYISGRSGQTTDVLLDGAGASVGISLYLILAFSTKRLGSNR